MNIEGTRANLHLKIDQFGRGSEEVQKASEKMDQKVLEEMLNQNPQIENNYLKRVIKAKDIQISRLQDEVELREQRIRELVEIAVMHYEEGLPMYRIERILGLLKLKEGLI